MSPIPLSAALGLADRLTLIIAGLRAAVAARMAADRTLVPLLTLLWSRLRRMSDRFARIAGARASSPRSAPPRYARRPSGPRDRLPSGLAWLLRLVPEAAVYGSQLQALLADPAMAALLKAAPQADRIVRPLCRMLAVPPGPASRPRGHEPERRPLGPVAAVTGARNVEPDPLSSPASRPPDVFARA